MTGQVGEEGTPYPRGKRRGEQGFGDRVEIESYEFHEAIQRRS